MAETHQALGLPASFDWEGRRLTVPPITLTVEALFAYELERRAYETIHRHRGAADEAAYQQHVRQWNDDVAAGEFEYNGRVGRHARSAPTGCRELYWLLLSGANGDWTRPDMDRLFRDVGKWNELVRLVDGLAEPPKNGPGLPAAAGTGSPSAPPT
jgi:hypothetical protein